MIPFSIYKHHSGRLYLLLFVANIHSDKWPPMAVYVDKGGKFWCRPVAEFEGKFVFLGDAASDFVCLKQMELVAKSFKFFEFKQEFKAKLRRRLAR